MRLDDARQLLCLSARIGEGHRADEQLRGAVALHEMLERQKVAYLADEVGMGKTYVALAVIALFRHVDPSFRVLVIAPRENIQRKWQKELSNFVQHNVAYADLRVRGLDGRSVRPMVHCDNLPSWVREVGVDPDRDFFLRTTSFSLALAKDASGWRGVRDAIANELPWLPSEALHLHNKETFKDRFADAVCCALPEFDLVIVDEAHNLKHGYGPSVSTRNRMLGRVFGRAEDVDRTVFRGYGRRAKRVLFLSATPVEEDYAQIHRQLDVFGFASGFEALTDPRAPLDQKKDLVRRILIRRVTSMRVHGEELTKNQYRREFRHGGVQVHDDPLRVADQRERLIVALMQKKVSEVLGHDRFHASFQTGMLASFESFGQTAESARGRDEDGDPDESVVFGEDEQAKDEKERHGIDVSVVNAISRSFRDTFRAELPHPKMNALVEDLAGAFATGEKALVFVRRVRSVVEIKRRLDDAYDRYLVSALKARLPASTHARLDEIVTGFERRKHRMRSEGHDGLASRASVDPVLADDDELRADLVVDDPGDDDTFFAYFMRGEGPKGVTSGAVVQRRFIQSSGPLATFFEQNHVAELLDVPRGQVQRALSDCLSVDAEELRRRVANVGAEFLSASKRVTRLQAFEAAQAAALSLLRQHDGPLRDAADRLFRAHFESARQAKPRLDLEADLVRHLERPTFFTELRDRTALREALWPFSKAKEADAQLRETALRAQLLGVAARLGHAFIDLYGLVIQEAGTLEPSAQAERDGDSFDTDADRIARYLDLLEEQRALGASAPFGAFRELAEIAANFALILDVNAPDAGRSKPLAETRRLFARMLARQQPTGGMVGGSPNKSLIAQFRMPGYPFVLVATDVLQEGEDLHTFCSRVYHYGIGWTPSSMEQRIGRIDRVRSATDRRLATLGDPFRPEHKLQVYYPHLGETVEALQVRRVIRRMDQFLRLMHEGLEVPGADDGRVLVGQDILEDVAYPPPIEGQLKTAFDVDAKLVAQASGALAVRAGDAAAMRARFQRLAQVELPRVVVKWSPISERGEFAPLLGTAHLGDRRQPFALYLRSHDRHLCVRCISPVGRVDVNDETVAHIVEAAKGLDAPVAAIAGREGGTYDVSVEDDVLLGDESADAARTAQLIRRVTAAADQLELRLLPGADAPLERFAQDLRAEGRDDD